MEQINNITEEINNSYTSTALSLSSINPIDLSGTRKIYIRSSEKYGANK